ncbi:hypothetical protein HNP55_003538 [Paucibacter oligotrophus]|uniref:Uncharacterized protein n=1 Tax=Roseateles oligotrophus TaxID=1769250 RepID=A0A840LED0_9BURK|nr:hypothetical protein [Roseateles oligotrophus]MBB4844992.1 hypothetical protein [Roseateles oligotrophus]
MANFLYDKAREAFGNAGINWLSDTISVMLIDASAYTVNAATDQFLSSIPSPARIGSAVALTGKTNVAGVMGAADVAFTGLVSAPTIEAVVLFKDTGNAATSALIAYIDTALGLPTSPGNTQVNLAWNTGANKIFKL